MKYFLNRNRIRITFFAVVGLIAYGIFISYQSNETKEIVTKGVAAKNAEIASLSVEKKAVEKKAETVEKQAQITVARVADSTAVVIQQKQEVIDSLIKKKPNEILIVDPDNPTAVAGFLSDYKPDTVRLESGPPVY